MMMMSTITLLNIYSTNYLQRLTLESWFTNLEQTPSTGVNH